jgi:hypothetical protein
MDLKLLAELLDAARLTCRVTDYYEKQTKLKNCVT